MLFSTTPPLSRAARLERRDRPHPSPRRAHLRHLWLQRVVVGLLLA